MDADSNPGTSGRQDKVDELLSELLPIAHAVGELLTMAVRVMNSEQGEDFVRRMSLILQATLIPGGGSAELFQGLLDRSNSSVRDTMQKNGVPKHKMGDQILYRFEDVWRQTAVGPEKPPE